MNTAKKEEDLILDFYNHIYLQQIKTFDNFIRRRRRRKRRHHPLCLRSSQVHADPVILGTRLCAPRQAAGYHHTLVWQQRGRRSTVQPGESSFIHCSGSSCAVTPIQTLTAALKDWGSVDSSPTPFSSFLFLTFIVL